MKTYLIGQTLTGLLMASCLLATPLSMEANTSSTPIIAGEIQNDQNTRISGTVTDNQTGEPLIGVSVSIVRDGKVDDGIITDFDGNFSMDAPTGDYEVHISYIGYQTHILKPGRDNLDNVHIRLREEENSLNDVVVTGFFNKNNKEIILEGRTTSKLASSWTWKMPKLLSTPSLP